MSYGFVSGGTNDNPTERDAEWLQAQKDLETSRREKQEAATQDGGKSLYEILQANKGDLHISYRQLLLLETLDSRNETRANISVLVS